MVGVYHLLIFSQFVASFIATDIRKKISAKGVNLPVPAKVVQKYFCFLNIILSKRVSLPVRGTPFDL
jgi:hypothetical protein